MLIASVIVSIRDAKGKISNTEIKFPVSATLLVAGLGAIAQEVASLVAPLINGQIVRVGVALSVTLPTGAAFAAANDLSLDSDVEEGARFQFRTQNGYSTAMRIPTFREDLMISGTDQVNLNAPEVQAFVDAMLDQIVVTVGSDTVTVNPSDNRGDFIQDLVFARESFLSSRGR